MSNRAGLDETGLLLQCGFHLLTGDRSPWLACFSCSPDEDFFTQRSAGVPCALRDAQPTVSSHRESWTERPVTTYLIMHTAERSASLKFEELFLLLNVEAPKITLHSQAELLKNKSLGCFRVE